MPASLLDSQLATLEPLQPDEAGAEISGAAPPDAVVDHLLAALGGDRAPRPSNDSPEASS
jgi:gluconokinase